MSPDERKYAGAEQSCPLMATETVRVEGLAGRRTRDETVETDPLAGEDESWADEDFLWTPDGEDYPGFLRALWVALIVGAAWWIAFFAGAFDLLS